MQHARTTSLVLAVLSRVMFLQLPKAHDHSYEPYGVCTEHTWLLKELWGERIICIFTGLNYMKPSLKTIPSDKAFQWYYIRLS